MASLNDFDRFKLISIESDTSIIYSIFLYESTMTTQDEPWFGELKLAYGVIGVSAFISIKIKTFESE
ncbi:hypothetical protein H5410_029695 [Solanum commersonii]|uniref:Uncharacterized protein n=1 Tax=Solanum commersonii TaxID=4109 RepID=A0A9J5YDY8_SOLCO|nr:hypothetical protein H5410_029695 [Solanum commersonii]